MRNFKPMIYLMTFSSLILQSILLQSCMDSGARINSGLKSKFQFDVGGGGGGGELKSET